MINIDQIKKLREDTGVSISECKKALEQANGDEVKAVKVLREWGKELAGKKSQREAGSGIIESYVHPDKKVGVIIELRCETDFVAKSEDFKNLAHEICLQITAMNPLFLSEDDISEDLIFKEKEIYQEQIKDSDKPKKILNQIIEGKLNKYKEKISLLSQPWVKDDSKTIKQLIEEYVAKIGENIVVKRFSRFDI
jgi:elongation factor Ts